MVEPHSYRSLEKNDFPSGCCFVFALALELEHQKVS